MILFTIGYEGFSISDFIVRLTANGIACVLDVRELPLSRKRGFSKKSFSQALQDAGIAYRHLSVFGCPRDIRDRYKVDENWHSYVRAFSRYLANQRDAVKELAAAAEKTSCCLVCFEADFNRCHRSLVARASRKAGGPQVRHLTATEVVADEADLQAA